MTAVESSSNSPQYLIHLSGHKELKKMVIPVQSLNDLLQVAARGRAAGFSTIRTLPLLPYRKNTVTH